MTFNNSILSGETLVRNSIQSENYESGVSGWRIARNGDVEFAEGTYRGDVIIENADSGAKVRITSDIVGTGEPGIVYTDDVGTILGAIFNDPNENGLVLQRSSSRVVVTGTAVKIFDNDGRNGIILRGDVATGRALLRAYHEGVEQQWETLTLQNGWTHQTGRYEPSAIRHPTGQIELCGGMQDGTNTDGTVVMTVPSNCIPQADVRIPVTVGAGENARAVIRETTGDVEVYGLGSSTSVAFDGVTYPVRLTL